MAHVNDVSINYGNTADGRAFADVQFTVNFDQQEMAQNIPFGMYLGLFAPESFYGANGNQSNWNQNSWNQNSWNQGNWNQGNWNGGNGSPSNWNGGNSGQRNQSHFASSLFGQSLPTNLLWSARETITPNGYRTLALSRRVTLNSGADYSQLPQLTAHIWMVPEHYEHRGMPYIGQYQRMNNPAGMQNFQRYFPSFYNSFQQPGMIGQNGYGEMYGPAYNQSGFGSNYGNWPSTGQSSGYGSPYGQYPQSGYGNQHSPNTFGVQSNGYSAGGWQNPGFGSNYGGGFRQPARSLNGVMAEPFAY